MPIKLRKFRKFRKQLSDYFRYDHDNYYSRTMFHHSPIRQSIFLDYLHRYFPTLPTIEQLLHYLDVTSFFMETTYTVKGLDFCRYAYKPKPAYYLNWNRNFTWAERYSFLQAYHSPFFSCDSFDPVEVACDFLMYLFLMESPLHVR